MPSWKRRLQRAATSVFQLPRDTVSDEVRVTCLNAREVVVENVVRLIQVSMNDVRLDVGSMEVSLTGSSFEVNLVSGNEIHLTGDIDSIRFHKSGGVRP